MTIALPGLVGTFSSAVGAIARTPANVGRTPWKVSMRRPCLTSAALLLGLAACEAREEAPVIAQREGSVADLNESTRSYMAVGERIATRSLGVKPGEPVLLFGTPEYRNMLEDFAVQVRKAGGFTCNRRRVRTSDAHVL
jgi:hypothetical protein